MANKYAVVSGAWSSTATWSDTDGGPGGASLPADDDYVIISATVNVLMNVDLSAFTGLRTVTIRGDDTTPGMLYFANGTSGYLKIRTTYNLVGTVGTYRGRLLANSDGVWGHTGDIDYTYKAVIDLRGTSKIDMQYLSAALYGTNPGIEYVHTYGQIFSECVVDAGNNTLSYTGLAAALPNGTLIQVDPGSGALPVELSIDTDYWVVEASGNTIKLSLSFGGSAIDLSAGGPIDILIGKYDNCTISGNYIVKPNHGLPASTCVSFRSTGTLPTPLVQDIQYWTANTPTTDGLLLAATFTDQNTVIQLGSTYSGVITMYTGGVGTYGVPGTNPYTTTAVNTMTDVTSDPQWSTVTDHNRVAIANVRSAPGGEIFDTQVITIVDIKPKKIKLSNSINSMQYPLTVLTLTSRNVSVRSYGNSTTGARIFDYALNCYEPGIFKCEITNMTLSASIAYNGVAIYQGREHIISGCISAVYYGTYFSANVTFSGVIAAVYTPAYEGTALRIGGFCSGVNSIIANVYGAVITTRLFGSYFIFYDSHSIELAGRFVGCQHTTLWGGTNINITGEIYSVMYLQRYPLRARATHSIVRRGAIVPLPPTFNSRNSDIVAEMYNPAAKNGLYFESYNNTIGDVRAYLAFGTIIKNTTVLRTGGGPYTLECEPLSLCNASHSFPLFDWREENVATIEQQRSVFIRGEGWGTFPTATQLYIEAEYTSDAETLQTTTIRTTTVLTDNVTWTEFALPAFTPAIADYVRYHAHLETYGSGCMIYVDCKLNGSVTKVIFVDGESALESMREELSNDLIEAAGGKFRVPPVDKVEKDYPYGIVV